MSLEMWPAGVWASPWAQQGQRVRLAQNLVHRQTHQCILMLLVQYAECLCLEGKKKSVLETGFVIILRKLDKIGTFHLNDPVCKDYFTHWTSWFPINSQKKHCSIKAPLPAWQSSGTLHGQWAVLMVHIWCSSHSPISYIKQHGFSQQGALLYLRSALSPSNTSEIAIL